MVIMLGQRYVVGLSDVKLDLAPIFKELTSSVDKTNRGVLGTHGTQENKIKAMGTRMCVPGPKCRWGQRAVPRINTEHLY